MKTLESIDALRTANPRSRPGFARSVEAAADVVGERIAAVGLPERRAARFRPRRRLVDVSLAGFTLAAAAAAAVFLSAGSSGVPGVESAAAAFRQAAIVTAASADRSGTAVVRITHGRQLWAGSTIRWHGGDLTVSSDAPVRPGEARSQLRVVDRILYGIDPRDGGWVVLGSVESIDPGSGTTPDELLAAVREDVGGATLRRFTEGMSGLTTRRLGDGSTVYSGTVAAGLIARETGFKEGQEIRVLPFGYVAHDEAADPAAPLDTTVTVGADGVVREVAVTWGTGASAWTYVVGYSGLGGTPAPVAPANARPLDRSPAGTP